MAQRNFLVELQLHVKKVHYVCVTPDGKNKSFKRLAYSLLDNTNNLTLIHYLGDHTVAVQFPHGNSKQSKLYYRTCPSLLIEEGKINDSPANAYKELGLKSSCSSLHQPVLVPRNVKQIKNAQAKERQLTRLSHDAIVNLHALAIDLDDYVLQIDTFPDMVVVCGFKELFQQLDNLISLTYCPKPVLLSYDTTFQLGDFYVSALLFRHVLFQSSPVIPAAFLIHDRKYQSAHEIMSLMKAQLPSLQKLQSPIPIVVDSETALGNAIESNLPGVKVVKCWNHVINAAKRWLREHLKGTSPESPKSLEIAVYVTHLKDLFHQPDEESYKSKLDDLKGYWNMPFREYYSHHIDPQVRIFVFVLVYDAFDVKEWSRGNMLHINILSL